MIEGRGINADGNVIKTFNIGLVLTTLALFSLGILTLYSATKGPMIQVLCKKQLIAFTIGLVLAFPLVFLDTQILEKQAYTAYAITLLLLGLVLVVGQTGGGSQRWLNLGAFWLQPSELAKIGIVLAFAKYFANDKQNPPYTIKRLLIPFLLLLPCFALILLQPDLGTAGIFALSAGSIIFFLRVHWKSILLVSVLGMMIIPVTYKFVLREYQRDRVKTFLDPGRDPRGSGYNSIQCKIAVGSGKLNGKGYLKGTQSLLNFIPEQHSDFIFSVFAEERGFVGGVVLLLLYFLYCFFSLRTISRARAKFEMLLGFGLTAILFWHVFINIGMVVGILPIVGVTLPFFSYGGTSLITFLMITGLLLNLSRKRYIF